MKNIEKPMPILLIEDNEVEVNEFKHYIEGRADAKLIKSTNCIVLHIFSPRQPPKVSTLGGILLLQFVHRQKNSNYQKYWSKGGGKYVGMANGRFISLEINFF